MKTWIVLGGMALIAACGGDGSGNGTTCGAGTVMVGDTCVGVDGGTGANTTCGAGTHLSGTMCVPDVPGATGAPTITSITPDHAGITGYELFTIQGTGFAGADVTDLHVYFGPEDPGCEAQVGVATATSIAGEVPPGCNIAVLVEVKTSKGMATTPFHYDAIYAADGRGDSNSNGGAAGDLYVIDPYASLYYDLGPLQDAATTPYGITGLAFSATGTLYGVTTAPQNTNRQLVTINPGTAVVTVVGDLVDAGALAYYVSDIKMTGTTLYGWGYSFDGATVGLVTINTATGEVTSLGNDGGGYGGGLAIDGAGVVYSSGDGAGADGTIGTGGSLDTVNVTTSAVTTAATLDYPIGASVNAMTFFGTTLVAAVNNGLYGVIAGAPLRGVALSTIDTATGAVSPAFEMPAQLATESQIDALDVAPPTLTIARIQRDRWQHLAPAAAPPIAKRAACPTSVSVRGGRMAKLAPTRDHAIALSEVASGTLSVGTCGGQTLTIAADQRAHYRLAANRRGQVKLVDTTTGRTVLRGVTSINATR